MFIGIHIVIHFSPILVHLSILLVHFGMYISLLCFCSVTKMAPSLVSDPYRLLTVIVEVVTIGYNNIITSGRD